jgi:2-haloacid dehalogenase
LQAYERLDAYPEAAASLTQLRAKGLRLAALSNGDPDMLEAGLRAAGLHGQLDAVLSVAPLRIFKPDRRVYELGRHWADVPARDVAFVSANAWDAGGGASFGFRTFWINRSDQPVEYEIALSAQAIGGLQDLVASLA